MCTAVDDGILMSQPLNLASGGGGTLLARRQTRTLQYARPGGVVLEVEYVLCIPSQRSHPDMEVRALEVGHSLMALLPYGVLLILNQEKHDRRCCGSDEVVLSHGGESNVRHHLNADVGLTAEGGPQPRLRGVEGYHHTDFAPVQAMGHGHLAMVDQSVRGKGFIDQDQLERFSVNQELNQHTKV
jgi:hypothetical protein